MRDREAGIANRPTQRRNRPRVADGSERLGRCLAHVPFLVPEGADQGWNCRRIPKPPEDARREHANAAGLVLKEPNNPRHGPAHTEAQKRTHGGSTNFHVRIAQRSHEVRDRAVVADQRQGVRGAPAFCRRGR